MITFSEIVFLINIVYFTSRSSLSVTIAPLGSFKTVFTLLLHFSCFILFVYLVFCLFITRSFSAESCFYYKARTNCN